jgi:hypothetical protein
MQATHVFNIHACPLWETNIDAQFILNPHIDVRYYTSHLSKIDKSITQEMEVILNKCKNNKIETFKCIKKNEKCVFKFQQMFAQQKIHITLSSILTCNKIISIYR